MIAKTRWLFALFLAVAWPGAFAATATANIQNFAFSPDTVTVTQGDAVIWTSKDPAPALHTVASDTGAWTASGNLGQGQTFAQVFNTPGTFTYHCSIHPFMTGTVKVVRGPEQARIQTGKNIITKAPKVLPISLKLAGKSAAQKDQIYLGSYIVNAQAGCANCHSCPTFAPGHNPYKGEPRQFNATSYLAGGVRVKGGSTLGTVTTAVSANLTPDGSGKPAGMTRAVFKDTLRKGHDPDIPGALLSVMPWAFFGLMTDNDLNAVYDYLSAIPKRPTPTEQCDSPGLDQAGGMVRF